MKEKIGNVILDYEKYSGTDLYSDGEIENILLDIVKNHKSEEFNQIIWEKKSWPLLYHLSHIRGNIVEWIPFKENAAVLEIGAGCGAITGTLAKKAERVVCVELSKQRSLINAYRNINHQNIEIKVGNFKDIEQDLNEKFDYIMLIGVLEYAGMYVESENPYEDFLEMISKHLKPDGKIIIAIENRLGLKYWAGCQEDHLSGYFKSIEGYGKNEGVRTFCHKELSEMVQELGYKNSCFYYPYPDYKFPLSIYSDEYLPAVGELTTNLRNYDRERLLLYSEDKAYDALITGGLFREFSNSFLVIMQKEKSEDKKLFVKYSNDRDEKFQIKTEIRRQNGQKVVVKVPCSELGKEHIKNMFQNYTHLKEIFFNTNISLNHCANVDNEIYFDFIDGHTLENELDKLLFSGKEGECTQLILSYADILKKQAQDVFVQTTEFETVFGHNKIPVNMMGMPCSDIDMIFSNILVEEEKWNVIDYEWSFNFLIPVNYILFRSIYYYVECIKERKKILKIQRIYELLNISEEERTIYLEMEEAFQKYINMSTHTLWNFYDCMGKHNIKLNDILEREFREITDYNFQFFWNDGSGFSESASEMVEPRVISDGSLMIEVEVPVDSEEIRIDPGNRCCKAQVLSFEDEKGKQLLFWDNGIHIKDEEIVYLTEDPQMYVRDNFPQGTKLCLNIELEFLNAEISKRLGKVLEEQEKSVQCSLKVQEDTIKQKENELQKHKEENERLHDIMEYKNTVIEAMENSLSWKLTKPLRNIRSMIKKR